MNENDVDVNKNIATEVNNFLEKYKRLLRFVRGLTFPYQTGSLDERYAYREIAKEAINLLEELNLTNEHTGKLKDD